MNIRFQRLNIYNLSNRIIIMMFKFFACCVKSDEKSRNASECEVIQRPERHVSKNESPRNVSQSGVSSFSFGKLGQSGANVSKFYIGPSRPEIKLDGNVERSETIVINSPEFSRPIDYEMNSNPNISYNNHLSLTLNNTNDNGDNLTRNQRSVIIPNTPSFEPSINPYKVAISKKEIKGDIVLNKIIR